MKNMVFNNTSLDVANYLAQRSNQFQVSLTLPELFERRGNGSRYASKLTEFKTKEPIPYRINLFVKENKVQLLIPRHTYVAKMDYASKYSGNCAFTFTFDEKLLEFSFHFDDYTEDITASSDVIDTKIKALLQEEVAAIFEGEIYTDRDAWLLIYEESFPNCTFKQIHTV